MRNNDSPSFGAILTVVVLYVVFAFALWGYAKATPFTNDPSVPVVTDEFKGGFIGEQYRGYLQVCVERVGTDERKCLELVTPGPVPSLEDCKRVVEQNFYTTGTVLSQHYPAPEFQITGASKCVPVGEDEGF